jgi:triphosphoribosyl-dephospho-CoA synthase
VTTIAASIAQAYLDACLAELHALKPGNVHVHAAGHGMTVADFEASARASAPAIAMRGASVGARIHEAIARTNAAVGCNTNLGIVLLCAPLAAAAEICEARDDARDASSALEALRASLRGVLAALTIEDAAQTFAAIRLASPAGLGEAPEHDVRSRPTVTLREAMEAAAARDRIAAQYANGYADVFDVGVATLARMTARGVEPHWAATAAYLAFLSRFPDSHVARKYGSARAEAVRASAEPFASAFAAAEEPAVHRDALLALDRSLKNEGVNPGTSADLTVASLFSASLLTRGIIGRMA